MGRMRSQGATLIRKDLKLVLKAALQGATLELQGVDRAKTLQAVMNLQHVFGIHDDVVVPEQAFADNTGRHNPPGLQRR